MNLLELTQELRLHLKKTANCKGGEYHGACPSCNDGVDRFMIWPEVNRYWCRRCEINGDAIQFCRDYMQMTFSEACHKTNKTSRLHSEQYLLKHSSTAKKILVAKEPPKIWQQKASAFAGWAQKLLAQSPTAMRELHQRGFHDQTIIQFKLGYTFNTGSWGSRDLIRDRTEWGLLPEYKPDGRAKKIWLPSGLVIPTLSHDGCLYRIKIRREKWHPEDPLAKYVEVVGSKPCASIYGEITSQVTIVLESELDAILIQQEAKDLCCCIALGGAQKRPDFYTDQLLRRSKLILCCLDNDEAGRKEALWWRQSYSLLKFWPVPIGKSPGDAVKNHSLDLREWVSNGIAYYGIIPLS